MFLASFIYIKNDKSHQLEVNSIQNVFINKKQRIKKILILFCICKEKFHLLISTKTSELC